MICPQRFVALAADRLLGAFLTGDARDNVVRFASGFPDAASGHILECRLDGDDGICDYSLALTRGDGGIERFLSAIAPGEAEAGLPTAILAHADVGIVWLEFDAIEATAFSAPSIFIAAPTLPVPPEIAAALAEKLFRSVIGASEAPPVGWLLERLPDGVYLKQSGMMTGRKSVEPRIRLVLDGVNSGATLTTLTALGWPGDMASAERLALLAIDLAGATPVRLDLDLGSRLGAELGIEITGPALRPGFTGRLESEGLCFAGRADALEKLAVRQPLHYYSAGSTPLRADFGLNHVKLVAARTPGKESAKAYFSLITIPDFSNPMP